MAPAKDTKQGILDAAIAVLQTVGTEGMTMRKVAAEAGMSLGNLQYHYKSKPALLAGLAEHYFAACASMLDDYQLGPEGGSKKEQLHGLVAFLLDHVDHISDMCRIFREMWALAAREDAMHGQLIDYYRVVLGKLTGLLTPLAGGEAEARRMASLLLPYIEGYSITFAALPESKAETAQTLTGLCWTLRRDR